MALSQTQRNVLLALVAVAVLFLLMRKKKADGSSAAVNRGSDPWRMRAGDTPWTPGAPLVSSHGKSRAIILTTPAVGGFWIKMVRLSDPGSASYHLKLAPGKGLSKVLVNAAGQLEFYGLDGKVFSQLPNSSAQADPGSYLTTQDGDDGGNLVFYSSKGKPILNKSHLDTMVGAGS